ncbi:hypothetical protein ADL03_09305 [Nocardia sp. NRRL S-836]|nr:hypothetical protein ADL03_09305 [Nocardia sp. NRRL S-836]
MGLLVAAVVRDSAPGALPVVGKQAPALALPRLDGQGQVSSADWRGKPVVLNFWSSWCGPCRDEFSVLGRHAGRDDVVVVGVVFQDSPDTARRFVDDVGARWPIGVDERSAAAIAYGVRGLPQTFLLDRDGVVAAVYTGPLSESALAADLGRLTT